MRSWGKLALVLACLIALCGLAGCMQDEPTPAAETTSAAKPPPSPSLPAVEHEYGARGYRHLVLGTFILLNEFWDNQVPDLGGDYAPPDRLISYVTRRQDPGCGGRPLGFNNAAYCTGDNSIAWDGLWVERDLFRRTGDAAVIFVLAHEYGHLVQADLGLIDKFPLTIEKELNADCLAGAFIDNVDRKLARLNNADIDALVNGLFKVGDPAGLPWQNPSAHGTAKERADALATGTDIGMNACMNRYGPGFSR